MSRTPMPRVQNPEAPNLTPALGVWAKRKNMTPIRFSKAMGWTYGYAYNVFTGKIPFSEASWGRFMMAFGLADLEMLFKIAGYEPKGWAE